MVLPREMDEVPEEKVEELNNEWRKFMQVLAENKSCKNTKSVWQLEVGAQGTHHMQIAIVQARLRWKVMRLKLQAFVKLFNEGENPMVLTQPHLEGARNQKDALAYCQKEDTRVQGPYCYKIMPLQAIKIKVDTLRRALHSLTSFPLYHELYDMSDVFTHFGIPCYFKHSLE